MGRWSDDAMTWSVPMRSLAILAAVAAATLWFLPQRRSGRERPPDLAAARATVVSYLNALEARDRDRLLALVPAEYDASGEIEDRLRRFGGARAGRAEIRFSAGLAPEVLVVEIRTVGPDDRDLAWRESVVRPPGGDGGWRLVLGTARERPPGMSLPSDTRHP